MYLDLGSYRQSHCVINGRKGANALEDAFQKKDEQVVALTTYLLQISRGLCWCEIHRFQMQRAHALRNTVGSLSAIKSKMSQNDGNAWVEISKLMGLDLREFEDSVIAVASANYNTLDDDTTTADV